MKLLIEDNLSLEFAIIAVKSAITLTIPSKEKKDQKQDLNGKSDQDTPPTSCHFTSVLQSNVYNILY